MTVLSTFLESSLNFLSNDLKKHYQIWYSQAEKHTLKGDQSGNKSPVKPSGGKKMMVFKHIFGILIKFPIQKP